MKTQLALASALMALSGAASAAQYACTVHCVNPSGKTVVTVNASSASDAASIVDKQGHQVCKAAGHGGATSSTMSASQCSSR
jgi:hypothetical protein